MIESEFNYWLDRIADLTESQIKQAEERLNLRRSGLKRLREYAAVKSGRPPHVPAVTTALTEQNNNGGPEKH